MAVYSYTLLWRRCAKWRRINFSPLGLRNPWNDSLEIWHIWLGPSSDPTCKIWWPPQMGMGWAYGWSCLAFKKKIGGVPSTRPQLTLKPGFSLNAPKNVFRWWVCFVWVGLPTRSNAFFAFNRKNFINRLTLSDRAHVYIRQYTIRDDVYVRRFSTISTRLIVQARIVSVT